MTATASRRHLTAGLTALLAVAAWVLLHTPPAHDAGSDLYGQLGVARHLLRGDGFVNDAVYPLSLAFPFAAHVPQPLVHRPPGPSLLLTLPVALSGGDPGRAERLSGWLSVLLLGGIVWFGVHGVLTAGRGDTVLPWLALLLANPLLEMTVGWSHTEIPTALLLIWLWTRLRSGTAPTPLSAPLDGALAAGVALLRPELAWLPWLWILWLGGRRRALLPSGLVWVVLMAPWWIRNFALTGDPVFTLQAYAEHLKGTTAWPGYAIYASLSPESFRHTLLHTPGLILDKTLDGLRYYLLRLDGWLPTALWIGGAIAAGLRIRASRDRRDPLLVLGVSLALATLLYAPLSHTLRYMAALMPVLSLELWRVTAERLETRGLGRIARVGILGGMLLLCLTVLPAAMPGWDHAREEAAASAARLPAALDRLAAEPEGPIFTDSAALLWYGNRAGVWIPEDSQVVEEIRRRVPEMERAPTVRQGPNAGGSGDD